MIAEQSAALPEPNQPESSQPEPNQPEPSQPEPSQPEPTLPDLTLKDFVLLLIGRRSRFRITGNSMLPLLKPNEEVLIDPNAYGNGSPQVGDVVLAIHPNKPGLGIIKCVAATEDGQCFLLGKNPAESTDSRNFGWVKNTLLQGQVICRFGS